MVSYRKIHFRYFILISLLASALSANPQERIYNCIQTHFQEIFESTAQSTEVTVGRIPESFLILSMDKKLIITSYRKNPRLGKQTIWVEAFEGSALVKKIPVNINVALLKQVCITKNRINRHQNITDDDVVLELKHLERLDSPVCMCIEKVVGLQPTKVLRAGSIIYSKYLRKPPVIASGDHVKVQVKTNNLLITTNGIAKQEGSEGDRISVLCEASGKRIDGLVVAPNLVVISREMYE